MDQKKTKRQVILFGVLIATLGWIGLGLDKLSGNEDLTQGLGALFVIASPLLLPIFIRGFKKGSWSDAGLVFHFKGNGKTYLMSIFAAPVISILLLLLTALFGGFSEMSFFKNPHTVLGASFGAILVGTLVKNVAEEFGWRSFLAPKVFSVVEKDWLAHLITNTIWFSWHLPYWFFTLDRAEVLKYTDLSLPAFVILNFVVINLFGVLYNEVRLKSKSAWPAYILHNVANLIPIVFLYEGFIHFKVWSEVVFGLNGLLFGVGMAACGLLVRKWRLSEE